MSYGYQAIDNVYVVLGVQMINLGYGPLLLGNNIIAEPSK